MITFDKDTHKYTNSSSGEEYISVTTLIGKYKSFFDKDKHSQRVAEREGVSQELVLEMWAEENKKAINKGNKIHKLMENYISLGEQEENYGWLYKSYERALERSIGKYKKVLTETLLYDSDSRLAGTADLIYENDESFIVGDFKTNKKFNYSSSFGEFLKPPIEHLSSCEFNIYALQLSMYAYMHEKITNKKCKQLTVFFLQEDRWAPIFVNYMKQDVKNILSDWRQKNLLDNK